jgi:pre-mRNA-processing factor SLU7
MLAQTSSQPEHVSQPVSDEQDSRRSREQNYSKTRIGEGDVQIDRERLRAALEDEKKRKARHDDDDRSSKKKKAASEQNSNHEVTQEELGWCFYFGFLAPTILLTKTMYRGLPDEQTDDG